MATLARIAANQRNAALSTGPKTLAGVAISKMNALSHGLRASTPVVPGEDPEQWEAYRDALLADLAPVGFVECELVERLALTGWRLRRVTTYEAGVIDRDADQACRRIRGERCTPAQLDGAVPGQLEDRTTITSVRLAIESAERSVARHARLARLYSELVAAADDLLFTGTDALDLLTALTDYLPTEPSLPEHDNDSEDDRPAPLDPMRDVRHTRFLLELEIPQDQHDEPEYWDGWTAGVIRAAVRRIARSCMWPTKWTQAKLLARAVRDSAAALEVKAAKLIDLRRLLTEVQERTLREEEGAQRRALVSPVAAEVVLKYESHLQRQWLSTLHELERRQASRTSYPPQPPVAIDVLVNAPDGLPGLIDSRSV